MKHTARNAGSFGIIGSNRLTKLNPKSTRNIIFGISKTKKINPKNSMNTLSEISTKIGNLEQKLTNSSTTHSSKTKLALEDYLKLDRLKKQQHTIIDNVNKIRNYEQKNKFESINTSYSTDRSVFESNLSTLENSVNNLINEIPKIGMFDSNRATKQIEYNAKREELKVYKAVKIFNENPSFFIR